MKNPVKLIQVGAGQRGFGIFGKYILEHPHEAQFEAIVDPDDEKRELFGQIHQIPKKNQFKSVKRMLHAKQRLESRAVINASGDKMHLKTSLPLIRNSFTLLLEKPMATTKRSCIKILQETKKYNAKVMICHVLRYSILFSKIKELIDSNEIGDIRTIEHEESIGEQHFAHSYVRGNWALKKTSGPISLTKTCHDFDIFTWLVNAKPKYLQSHTDSLFFQKINAPYEDVPKKCHQGCKFIDTCKFAAEHVYSNPHTPEFMKRAVSIDMDEKTILKKLKTGPYGTCVYRAKNDVPDFQTTKIVYTNGVIVHFTMTARKKESNRTIFIIGSKGRIYGDVINSTLILENYNGKQEIELPQNIDSHGGGDAHLIHDFIQMIQNESSLNKTSIDKSLESHILAFAAETSRLQNKKINFKSYYNEMLDEFTEGEK